MITTLEHVKLEWVENTKPLITAVNVYRSEAPFDMATPPTSPLATLNPGVLVYIDETAEINKTYHYTVSAVVDGVEDFSIVSRTVHTKDPRLVPRSILGRRWMVVGEHVLDASHGSDAGTYMIVVYKDARRLNGYQITTFGHSPSPSDFSTPGASSRTDGMANTLACIAHSKTSGDLPHFSYPAADGALSFKASTTESVDPDLQGYIASIEELRIVWNTYNLDRRSRYWFRSTRFSYTWVSSTEDPQNPENLLGIDFETGEEISVPKYNYYGPSVGYPITARLKID